jgi:type IV pilus assembly protein PilC
MPIFKYKIIDQDGNPQNGFIEAPNEEAAAQILREKNLTVITLKEEKIRIRKFNLAILNKIKAKDLVVFSRQFSVMISASVPMVQALKILVEQTENPRLKKIIFEIATNVDGGLRLSESLSKYPEIFSVFYISVIKIGETSGKLEEVLGYLADELEADYDLTNKIKGALTYPAFILAALFGVGIFMMIFVVPKLTQILEESGAELPIATKILIAASDFFINFWWMLAIIFVISVIGFIRINKTKKGKEIIDRLKLFLPIFGNLFKKIYLVRFSRSMNTLILGGVTITDSLKKTAEAVDNFIYRSLIEETLKEVEEGNPISGVFARSKFIPKMVSQMMNVGERTGKLNMVLAKISTFYEREINNTVTKLVVLMEPIVMVIMGVGVGIMIAAIILPMYNIAGQGG